MSKTTTLGEAIQEADERFGGGVFFFTKYNDKLAWEKELRAHRGSKGLMTWILGSKTGPKELVRMRNQVLEEVPLGHVFAIVAQDSDQWTDGDWETLAVAMDDVRHSTKGQPATLLFAWEEDIGGGWGYVAIERAMKRAIEQRLPLYVVKDGRAQLYWDPYRFAKLIEQAAKNGGGVFVVANSAVNLALSDAAFRYAREHDMLLSGLDATAPPSQVTALMQKVDRSPRHRPLFTYIEGSIRYLDAQRLDALSSLRASAGPQKWVVFTAKTRYSTEEEDHAVARHVASKLGVPVYTLNRQGERVGAEPPVNGAQPTTRYVKTFAEALEGVHFKTPPAVPPRPFGACRRCRVCLAFDVNQGCCTVCGDRLRRLPNPRALKRRLLR